MSQDAGTWIITELLPNGMAGRDPIVFLWTASLRSAPLKPWVIGLSQQKKRTKYPGGSRVSKQMLGPDLKEQKFTGEWIDKYNAPGFARDQMQQLGALVAAGNRVRIEFSGLAFIGTIDDVDFPYKSDDRIGYEFVFSADEDASGDVSVAKRPARVLSFKEISTRHTKAAAGLSDLNAVAPVHTITGTTTSDFDAVLDTALGAVGDIDAMVNGPLTAGAEVSRGSILRLVQLFAEVKGACARALTSLAVLRSDVNLGVQLATDVLNFDVWCKGMGEQLRALMLTSDTSQRDLASRAQPTVRALYRPEEGEHLQSVSLRFYGTPHNWRVIYERNGLTRQTLSADMLLVIPDKAS